MVHFPLLIQPVIRIYDRRGKMTKVIITLGLMALLASTVQAANIVRQLSQANNASSPQTACKNPRLGFSFDEVEKCIMVYQSCMRPELKQYERERCLIDRVKNRQPTAAAGKRTDRGSTPAAKNRQLTFSFDSFQAYDLVEMCEQRQNRKRPICAGAILPNKPKIIKDINHARQQ